MDIDKQIDYWRRSALEDLDAAQALVRLEVLKTIRSYVRAARRAGIHVNKAILFGSHARGTAREESDIDLAVIAPEFDARSRERLTRKLWALRATTDNRIEPLAIGRTQWLEDQGSPIIEIVRREGIPIALR